MTRPFTTMRMTARLMTIAAFAICTIVAQGQSSAVSQSARLVEQGALELKNGNTAVASQLFERALRLNARNADAHTYMGVIADQKNDLLSAEKHFAAAVAATPRSASAHNNLGTVLLKLDKREKAITELEKSLQFDDQQPGALVNLGQAYFARAEQSDLRRAHDLFARAEKLSPDPSIARALLVTSIRRHDQNSAKAEYSQYTSGIDSAPAEVSGPAARLEIGRSLLEVGLNDEAIQELHAVLATEPDNAPAIAALGKAYRVAGDIPAAGKTLESAVARGVASGDIYAELAEVYEASGHVENAIPAMRRAIAADPKNERYYLRYGLLLNDTKAPAAAITRLQEAVKLFPSSAALQFALGLAYYADHKNEDASTCFDHSIALDPNFAPAFAYRGLVFADAGKYSEAIEQYQQSLALDPEVAVAHELIGEAILRQPNPDTARAETELRRAIELDPHYMAAGLELAKLLQREGNPSSAAKELERLVKVNPDLAEPHYLLGRTYAALKRTDDSKREFERFQELDKAGKQAEVDARNDLLKRLANVRY